MNRQYGFPIALGAAALSFASSGAFATCQDISWDQINSAALYVKNTPGEQVLTGGLRNNMWVTMVDETGKVCHVVNTAGPGQNSGSTWAVSRVISAQKANTSAGLSLNAVGANPLQAWASGALILAAMPVLDPTTGLVGAGAGALQGTLYGVQFSNPVDAGKAYAGNPNTYGTKNDPLKNKRIGGINVFGGGLPLYSGLQKIGAIGVSGDSSCTDHAFAWRVREKLAADLGINNAVQIAAASGVPEVLNITGKLYPGCAPVNPPFSGPANGLQ
ncbi:MAG TPA: heme-binding protein [Methylococcus sp.]|nr:heme-binding protein [Methylococcus sp.]